MKQLTRRSPIFWLPFPGLLLLLWSSCFSDVQCECLDSVLQVEFIDSVGNCELIDPATIDIEMLDPNTNRWSENPSTSFIGVCGFLIPINSVGLWRFQSDELGISDTLEIAEVSFSEPGGAPCNCAPVLEEVSMRLGGEMVGGSIVFVSY